MVGALGVGEQLHRQVGAQRRQRLGEVFEVAFLLALPMLRLAASVSGRSRLTVEQRNEEGGNRIAGVMVETRRGRIVSCTTRLQGDADAWVSGSPDAWLGAVIEGDAERLDANGIREPVTALLDALREGSTRLDRTSEFANQSLKVNLP